MSVNNVNEWVETVIQGGRNFSALVVYGPQGSGKGVAVRLLQRVAKLHYVTFYNALGFSHGDLSREVVRDMTESELVVIDECDIGLVKPLITEKSILVEAKGRDAEMKPIKANLVLTPLSKPILQDDDRRFVITTPIELIAILTGKLP